MLNVRRSSGASTSIPINVSIGVAALNPYRSSTGQVAHGIPTRYFEAMAQTLIQRSDDALYRAKALGGNQVCRAGAFDWAPLES
jgi:GGDEF domain-containing protein